jgi:hypothetical protein
MRPGLILGGLAIGVLLIAAAWLWLPAWDFLVEPVQPDVRDRVNRAIEAASESPEEQARLRLELAALEQEDAGRRSGLRGTIAQVGAAVVAGSVAAWGAVSAWRQLQVSREGQITERFTRAVDQLGKESLDVRLGGIHALQRIARESPADRPAIVNMLGAFVLGHQTDQSLQVGPGEIWHRKLDLHAAIMVVREQRRPTEQLWWPEVELVAADLRGADFTEAWLARMFLLTSSRGRR